MNQTDVEKLEQIFLPYSLENKIRLKKEGIKLAHYTSAEAALSILKNRILWMRDPTFMNDHSEISHGISCLDESLASNNYGDKFLKSLRKINPKIVEPIEHHLEDLRRSHLHDIFITCLSEHHPIKNHLGRLSMWRAYGQASGIALVFKIEPIFYGPGILKVYASKAGYFTKGEFADELKKIITNIESNSDYLRNLDPQTIVSVVLVMLRFAILSTKHPGFGEEEEWRLLHFPESNQKLNEETIIKSEYTSLGSVPQKIFKIPLRNLNDGKRTGADLAEILDHIIIGPSKYPLGLYKTFYKVLSDAGIEDPGDKITISNKPLRL